MATANFTTNASSIAHYDGQGFSIAPVLHTAEHAVCVYLDAKGYESAVTEAGFDGGTIVDMGSAEVGLAWSSDVIVVCARGSDDAGDWMGNLALFRVRWPGVLPDGCRVGYGFRKQAKALGSELVRRIAFIRADRPDAKIVVTGHSLGAALVFLLVSYFDAKSIGVEFAVAHESPRVGNKKFAKWYDDRFTRGKTPTWSLVNVSKGEPDIVTRLPKRRWGFRHAGRRVILAASQTLFGVDAWKRHRDGNPVGHRIAAWRIFSRFYSAASNSVRAHYGRSLLESLRGRTTAQKNIEGEP